VRVEHENELTELVERERFIREREKRRKGSGRVVGADGDRTSSKKNTEDEPRGVVFKHDMIGGNG
jgi:hypothetical protein